MEKIDLFPNFIELFPSHKDIHEFAIEHDVTSLFYGQHFNGIHDLNSRITTIINEENAK